MKRRSEGEWRKLFAEQAASGKTAVAFCQTRGLDAKYFSKRRCRLSGKRMSRAPVPKRSAFVAVRMPAQAMRLHLPSGVELELPGPVSAGWLAELVGALGG